MVAPIIYAAGYVIVEYGIPMLVTGYVAYQTGQILADREEQIAFGQASSSLTNALTPDRSDENERTDAQSTTNEATRNCDGPHRGRLQVQGNARNIDPPDGIEISWPWNRPCVPPLRPEGLLEISALLERTREISPESAGWRGGAFAKMSRFISGSGPSGLRPSDSGGWSITEDGKTVRNRTRGVLRNAARVDIEILAGRAFGDY